MKLIVDSTTKDLSPWIEALKEALPEVEVVTWADNPDPKDVTAAILWNHRESFFRRMQHVRLVCSLGAGVDHILSDPLLPAGVMVTRIVSDALSGPMSMYCIGAITWFERKFDYFLRMQAQAKWDQQFDPERHLHVGIMGLGVLGQDLAAKLVSMGFEVSGWSRTAKVLPGVTSYGEARLDDFIRSIDLLVCMLPATHQTRGILSRSLFDRMKPGTFLINVARGQHQVNEDIIEALDSGQLAGAFLDVFPVEPLPEDDPLWHHPKVVVTPHIAVVTKLEAAIPQIAQNIRNFNKGLPLINTVDRDRGY